MPPLADYFRRPLRLTAERFAADVEMHLGELKARPIVVTTRNGRTLLLDADRAFELAVSMFRLVSNAVVDPQWSEFEDKPQARKSKPKSKRT